jgi:methylglutaconyl-CoA hydratase
MSSYASDGRRGVDVLIESEPLPGMVQLVLNRPQVRNALDSELVARLRDRLSFHKDRDATRVIILRAAGAAFCSGVDLRTMAEKGRAEQGENESDALALACLLAELRGIAKPTVAAVQGPAFGAGVGLVAACDVAVGAEEAKFCLPEVRLGVVPAVVSPYILEAIGTRHARRYMLSGEMISSERAREIGLLHEVVPTLALGGEALRFATDLAQGGPVALASCKALLAEVDSFVPGRDRDVALSRWLARLRASEEGQTGLAAMLSRRAPPWAP